MCLLRIFVIIVLFCLPFFTAGRDIMFNSLGIGDGLSQLTVHSIYQDETGAMWFGTRRGLNRYDGTQIESIQLNPAAEGFNRQIIWKIAGNRNGSLFIHADGDLIRYDLKKEIFENLWDDPVEQILYRNEKLYVCSNSRLYLFDPIGRNKDLIASLEGRHNPIKQILVSRQEILWLATSSGLLKISLNGDDKQEYFKGIVITSLMEDENLTLWLGTYDKGIIRFNPHNETFTRLEGELARNEIRCFETDEKGDIWAGTFKGLFRINPNTGKTDHYLPVEKMPYSLSHSSVYSLYKDQQGTIWTGTYFGGVNFFNPGRDVFRLFSPSSYYPDHISFPIVGNIAEDKNGFIWICTEGGGLNRYDPGTGQIKVFRHHENKNSLSHDNLKSLWYTTAPDRLFIGTHTGGLSELDLKSGVFRSYLHDPENPQSIPNNVVNKISGYGNELFLLTQRGLIRFNTASSRFSPFFGEEDKDYARNYIHSLYADSKGRLWLTYQSNELFRADLVSGAVSLIVPELPAENGNLPLRIVQVFEDRMGRIFLIVEGVGIIQLNKSDKVEKVFSSEDGILLSDLCFNIAEAPSGRLIITSDKGITFLDTDRHLSRHYPVRSAIPLSGIIEENGLYVARNGEIFVGGTDGMVSFFEHDLESVTTDYNLYFNRMYVNNKLVIPGDVTGILDSTLFFKREVRLKHRQTNIIFGFTSSNYIRHLNHEYEYMLEGFDKSWIPAQSRSITYTNISPGSYTLRVREKGQDVAYAAKEASILISVAPAWYASHLAYTLYFLIFLGLLTGYIVFDRNRTMLKASLEFERKEKLRIEELNQSKLRFFTNISHEFRTPLTLIVSQTEMILQNPAIPSALVKQIGKIQKHAMRMRQLVNELLDFRKQEQGHLKIKVARYNIVEFLSEVFQSFEDYATARDIGFTFENPGEPLEVWFDPVQMQKVFYNLLSNAFKFTSAGDRVRIRLIPKTDTVVIKITDSGKGIPVNELNRIFDRFYQAENISSDPTFVMSSGIGLALTKGIIELHGGNITVESMEGEGSTFRVELPLGDNHFEPEQKIKHPSGTFLEIPHLMVSETGMNVTPDTPGREDGEKPAILIAEDNEDVLQVLAEMFSPMYNVYTASNGEEGFVKTMEIIPDIVLSDVMMARMSGRELCRKIKSQFELSHIPVVLLTSLNSPEQIAEGFIHGADDYVTKPFDARVLIIRCNNLVNSRRLLRERFSKMLSAVPASLASSAADQELLRKIDLVIEDNLDNNEFNIDLLAQESGMGRSKLYAVVKEITGITPNTYILNYKMNKAANWLKTQPNLTVSEVAYKLGFNAARYFSLCFKDHYGLTPNDYRRKNSH